VFTSGYVFHWERRRYGQGSTKRRLRDKEKNSMLSPLPKRAGSRLREPFGKAGLTVAVIALVFAMLGGAYAAGKLTSKQKKEVEKIAKKFQGTGPAGAQGPAGANGKDGAQGPKGDAGSQGIQGEKGDKGAKGETGSPWTAGGTLPSGKTETGAWSVAGSGAPVVSIPFSLPLAASLNAGHVHYINAAGKEVEGATEKTSTVCLGSDSNPTAAAGHLCVYVGSEFNASSANEAIADPSSDLINAPVTGASKAGAVVQLSLGSPGLVAGTYAVTAP
jgi:collagen triple helix repeat protein